MENKEKLKKKLNEVKQKYDSVDEYRQEFHKHFDTIDTSNINTKVLKELFSSFIDQLPQTSKVYDYIFSELNDVENKIVTTLDENQKELFKMYNYIQSEFLNECGLEAFVHGFALANELNVESKSYSNNNNLIKNQLQELKTNSEK